MDHESEKQIQDIEQRSDSQSKPEDGREELKKLRLEEKVMQKLLDEAKGQLIQLQVIAI